MWCLGKVTIITIGHIEVEDAHSFFFLLLAPK